MSQTQQNYDFREDSLTTFLTNRDVLDERPTPEGALPARLLGPVGEPSRETDEEREERIAVTEMQMRDDPDDDALIFPPLKVTHYEVVLKEKFDAAIQRAEAAEAQAAALAQRLLGPVGEANLPPVLDDPHVTIAMMQLEIDSLEMGEQASAMLADRFQKERDEAEQRAAEAEARAAALAERLAALEAEALPLLELDECQPVRDGEGRIVLTPAGAVSALGDLCREALAELGEQPAPEAAPAQLDALQRAVGEWGEQTFPRSTQASVVAHLGDEVRELAEGHDPVEAADCLLLLLHHAHKGGYSLLDTARRTFGVNQARIWGEPDERGVVRHVDARAALGEGQDNA